LKGLFQTTGYTYESWTYTGVAYGDTAFAVIIDAVPTLVVPEIAITLGVTKAIAQSFITGLAISYGLAKYDIGTHVANYMDKNHNGWIGTYYRQEYYNGKAVTPQKLWKTE
jgi:hypothetical protein